MYNFDLDVTYDNDDDYRYNLLKVFNLHEENSEDLEGLTEAIDELYNYLVTNKKFEELFKKNAEKYFSEELEIGFTYLLSYTHFTDFHNILKEYHNKKTIDDMQLNYILQK